MRFSKLWINDEIGWEDTMLSTDDFTKVVEVDFNMYVAIDANDKPYFLKR